jgi:hypothetical protein
MGNLLNISKKPEEAESEESAVEHYIDSFLHNEKINTCLPDKMERKMYKKVLTKTIALLEKVLETTEIKILNHRVRFVLEPIEIDKESEKRGEENV